MYYRFWPADTPHISAMILTSLIIVMDIGLIAIVLLRKLGLDIGPNKNAGLYGLIIYILMVVITYLVIVRPRTYRQISDDFDSRTRDEKRKLVIKSIIFNLTTYFFAPVTFIINAILD
jgi:membrane protein YdbS with pleckstrin-like domain